MDHSTSFIQTKNISNTILPRQGHSSFIYKQKIYILFGFGGVGKHLDDFDDLFELDTNLTSIKSIATRGFRPTPRAGQSIALFQDKVFLFGGFSGPKRMSDLYELDLNTMEWRFHSYKGIGISHHSCVSFSDKIFIFGGQTDQGNVISELKIWNVKNNCWEYNNQVGEIPFARSHHSACVFNDEMLIFGGYSSPNRFNDLYSLNLKFGIWKKIQVNGKTPYRLSEHTANVLNHSMLIYGGFDGKNGSNHLHEFDLLNKKWKKKKVGNDKRYLHSSVVFNDTLYLIMGYDGKNLIQNICSVLLCENMIFRKKMLDSKEYFDVEINFF